jgi:hypothetical protein
MVRDGQRNVPEMYPMVMNLSDQDLADISAFYEQQRSSRVWPMKIWSTWVADLPGRQSRQWCSGLCCCHGPSGDGIPGAYYSPWCAHSMPTTRIALEATAPASTNGEDDPFSLIMVGVGRET